MNLFLFIGSLTDVFILWNRVHTLKGHNRRVNACAADPKGKLIASGAWDSTVILWKVLEGKQECYFNIDRYGLK